MREQSAANRQIPEVAPSRPADDPIPSMDQWQCHWPHSGIYPGLEQSVLDLCI